MSEAAAALVGLHSSDPVTVYLSARARVADVDPAAIERALYHERTVVRMLGMRRTLFVVPRELRPVVQAACTDAIAARERARLEGWIAESGIAADPSAWLQLVEQLALGALEALGEAATAELAAKVPELRERVQLGQGKWAASVGVGTRVLPLLAAQGRILRGRPRGTWISSQYRWSPATTWLGEEQPAVPVEAARVELIRRWLHSFGPGTLADLRWWTGLGAGEIRTALAEIATVEVDLDGTAGFVLAVDLQAVDPTEPWAALLPSLDPTVMGWAERDWYLGDHVAALFDSNGNAGPTVWWDGRVVGGWTQRRSGEIAYRLLENAGSEARAAIDAEVERLVEWLGDVRLTPRFATPLVRELA